MFKRWYQFIHNLCNVYVIFVIVFAVLATSLVPLQRQLVQAMSSSVHVAQYPEYLRANILRKINDSVNPTQMTGEDTFQTHYGVRYNQDSCSRGQAGSSSIEFSERITLTCLSSESKEWSHSMGIHFNTAFLYSVISFYRFTCTCPHSTANLPVKIELLIRAYGSYLDKSHTQHFIAQSEDKELLKSSNNAVANPARCNCKPKGHLWIHGGPGTLEFPLI